jgi:hypothetical protein
MIEEPQVNKYFSGLSATIKSVREVQKIYDPIVAFNFNSLNFFKPGENKVSEILAFFLDPKKPHGQGAKFLELFLKKIEFDKNILDLTKVECECEHGIEGQRRIDVLIKFGDNDFGIAIENKLWGKDQENQLKDYNEALKNKGFKTGYLLLYLTPYQNDPRKESIDVKLYEHLTKNGRLQTIGYTDHIIGCVHDWAMNCTADRVRSFLLDFEQYLKNEFLGEIIMDENKIIAEYALKNEENLEVAFGTFNAFNTVQKQLMEKLASQFEGIAIKYGFSPINNLSLEQNSYFHFSKEIWIGAKIAFQFEGANANGFKYGICYKDENVKLRPEVENNLLTTFKIKKSDNSWWLFHSYFEPKNWGNKPEPWIEIQNGKLKERIEKIIIDYTNKIGDKLSHV